MYLLGVAHKMKKCLKCSEEKPLSSFYKQKGMRDGHLNKCKECTRRDVKKNSMKVGSKYDFTEHGVIRVIYKTQKRHQKIRGHGCMVYSRSELSSWMYENGYKDLYDQWVMSGYDSMMKPSVDRLNSLNGYSFDNIRLITWGANIDANSQDIINAKGSSGRRCKALLKLDIEMKTVCEYVSYSSAVRDTGYSLEYQIKNKITCRNGFYWKYK